MDIIIQSQGFTAGEQLEGFVREKVSKLATYDPSIIRADVILKKDHASNIDGNVCEIRLEVPGYDDFVKKVSSEYETSVMEAVDTLQTMVQKRRSKQTSANQGNQ
jgi:putative sigma-54 modulation protein